MTSHTVESLKAFESECCVRFLNKEIRSPMHLSGGNELQLIEIFKNIRENDWIFTTYRSHYHALLKGMPKEELMQKVLGNSSMHIMSSKYKIVSTAIVGGQVSQAVGAAIAVKLKKEDRKVFCFLGDMAGSGGIFHDCLQYAVASSLPIVFIIENNLYSTDTPSYRAWNMSKDLYTAKLKRYALEHPEFVIYYEYERIYPHYGVSIPGNPEKRLSVDFNKENKL